ncbi:ribosomal biogenesis protein LAS1L [Nephila pilipes]|uniref:Ribosomal biogenesis protein LAS1L n=1 Tax=Nephila pilipes TaxID=299642 RepID=A0A8X6NZT4_NEPPI|nr:ribosomal biogenesis protein LAS1L [Nephila pilipes]
MNSEDHLNLVPWMNPDQFRKVYQYLYSKSISDKRWAVDQIAVWETRCYPALPTAIEATVVLVRAVIQDLLFEAEKTFCQEGDIQMLYSMALVRFVNIIAEHQRSSTTWITVASVAMKLNIPLWIIDLRNDASHSICPSLPLLRMGAERALLYLEDAFWKTEAVSLHSILNVSSGLEGEILASIEAYKNLQFQSLEKRSPMKHLDQSTILKKIQIYIKKHWKMFVNILVQPSVFTAAEDLVRLLKISDVMFLEDEENMYLPIRLEKFWLPLLHLIHRSDLIPNFLESLLIAQEKCKIRICQKAAIAWAVQIFTGPSASSPMSNLFRRKGLLFDLHRLLYACLKSTNQYSMHFFDMVIQKLGDRKKYCNLFCILALYQGVCLPEEQNLRVSKANKEMIFTVEDVEEDLNELKRNGKPATSNDNIWSLAPVNMDFTNIPLGAVLNTSVLNDSEMESVEPEERGIVIGPHPDDNFIILNKNDDEGTVEEKITVDTNMLQASFLVEKFGMIYSKRLKR